MPLIVIRPQPGCNSTVMAAMGLGMNALAAPLFTIDPLPWQAPASDSFDALLLGSANALRHSGDALAFYAGKPCYVVGEATGAAAEAAGLHVIAVAEGGLQSVLDQVSSAHARLLRLGGEERVQLTVPENLKMTEKVVYRAVPQPIPPPFITVLRKPCIVMLHSAAAARHFSEQCETHDMNRSTISLAVIGPRVGSVVGKGWRRVSVASHSNDAALLALAGKMCQEVNATSGKQGSDNG
jgi:uroporphyrinogen-III synthase